MAPVRDTKVNPRPRLLDEYEQERLDERRAVVWGAVLGIAIVVMVALAVAAVAQVAGGPW